LSTIPDSIKESISDDLADAVPDSVDLAQPDGKSQPARDVD
jgi:hypothetical protein